MRVRVAWSPRAGEAHEVELDLPAGSRVEDAVRATGVDGTEVACLGVWGRLRGLDHVLSEGDRVELYRPLEIDPKEARRRRATPRRR